MKRCAGFVLFSLVVVLLLGSCSIMGPEEDKVPDLNDTNRYVILGGDMVLDKNDPGHRNLISLMEDHKFQMTTKAVMADIIKKWPDGIVRYSFSTGPYTITAEDEAIIHRVMRNIELVCNVRFVKSLPGPYVYKITKQSSHNIDNSSLGYIDTPFCKIAEFKERDYGHIMHEFLHGLGFAHEQCRWDRDYYINVDYDNIRPGYKSAYEKLPRYDSQTFNIPFDLDSVMLYSPWAYAKDQNHLVYTTKKPYSGTLGQRDHLSLGDIQGLIALYGPNKKFYRIKNRWTGLYLHIEKKTGFVQVGNIQSSWESAQWQLENHEGYIRLKNKWTGEYLHNEHKFSYAECSYLGNNNWWSADWILEENFGYFRFKNRWSGYYAHNEYNNGFLQTGNLGSDDWWSCDWQIEEIYRRVIFYPKF